MVATGRAAIWATQNGILENHSKDEAYKSFSEVFSRLFGEKLAQPPASNNAQDQQKDGPLRTYKDE